MVSGGVLGVATVNLESHTNPWIRDAQDPGHVSAVLAAFAPKIPAQFYDRLQYRFQDGTLRVMVATVARDAVTQALAIQDSTWVQWYGTSARFMARVTPDQLADLVASPLVRFVDPDYPLTYMLAQSVVDVHARSGPAPGSGIWRFDATTGPMGRIVSDVPGISEPITGKGVTIAIADSGIDKTHRDFGGWDCAATAYAPCDSRIKAAFKLDAVVETSSDPGPFLPTTDLASGHGTHTAGIALGNGYYARDGEADPSVYGGDGYAIGVAPEASLVSISDGDSASAAFGVAALQWELDHAAEYGIRVSSNSWGCASGCAYSPNSAEAQVQRDLYNAGVVVTFAAGNSAGTGSGAEFSGDSQSPYIVSVANYDDATHQLSSSSSRGAAAETLPDPAAWTPQGEGANGHRRPDIAAPGEGIWSARSLTGGTESLVPRVGTEDVLGGGTNGIRPYAQMSGTSMATPHVAGTVALLVQACPDATPLDLMRALFVGADATRVTKTGSSVTAQPFEVGYGGLDARASLDWLLQQPVCGTAPPTGTRIRITSPAEGAQVSANSVEVTGDVDRAATLSSAALMAAASTGGVTLYFHHGTVPENNVDGLTDGALMDPNPPTSATPSVAQGVWGLDGTTAMTPYDANWATPSALSLQGQDVTVHWWITTAAQDPAFAATWDVRLWQMQGTTWTVLAQTDETNGQKFTVPLGAPFAELQWKFPSVTTLGDGLLAVTLNGHFGLPDGAHAIYYDSVDRPSRLEIALPPNQAPIVSLAADTTEGGVPLPVQFTLQASDPDGTLASWSLDYGDGTPPDEGASDIPASLGHTYESAGSFVATLTATDQLGAVGTATVPIAVGVVAPVEHVDLLVDGSPAASVHLTTGSAFPTAQWAATLDLAGQDGAHTISARWIDADGTLLDEAVVNVTAEAAVTSSLQITDPAGDGALVDALPATFAGTYTTGSSAHPASAPAASPLSSVPDPLRTLLLDPDAQQTLRTPQYDALVDNLRTLPGFVTAAPIHTPAGTQILVAFTGDPPAKLPPAPWPLLVAPHVTPRIQDEPAARPTHIDSIPAALSHFQSSNAPTGPPVPGLQSGIGPGTGFLVFFGTDGFLCSTSYLFQNPETGIYYLATAGHCLLAGGEGPATTGQASPSRTATAIDLCYAACAMNALQLGSYIELTPDPATGYHPVAFARAEGVGVDFGLIEIPHAANGLLRPWLTQWGGPTRYEVPQESDLLVHYGHGTYCCPVIGGVASRTPADQGRVALDPLSDATSVNAFGSITGGDSGSAAGTGAVDPARPNVGRGGSAVLTHGSATQISAAEVDLPILFGTLLEQGQDMSQGLLGFRPRLVTENETIQAGSNAAILRAVITDPQEGARIDVDAATSVPITGTATFAPTAGTPGTETQTYYLHNQRGADCTATTQWMDATPSPTSETGSGCGSLLTAGGVVAEPAIGPQVDLEFPAAPAPADDVYLDATRTADATVYMGGFLGDPVLVGDFEARLESQGVIVAQGRATTLPVVDGFASVPMQILQPVVAAGTGLQFRFIVHQASATGAFLEYGGTGPSNVRIPLALPPVKSVQLSIDDASFDAAAQVPVTGTAAWSAAWDLGGVAVGEHTLYARALEDDAGSDASVTHVTLFSSGPKPPTAAFTTAVHGLEVSFLDASVPGDAPITSWSWDLGDGTSSTEANPTHTYAAPATYTVNLTVTDANDKSGSVVVPVAVSYLAWQVQARIVDGAGQQVLPWTAAGEPGDLETGSWSLTWAPDARPPEGAYVLEARLLGSGQVVASAARSFRLDFPNQAPVAAISGPNTGQVGDSLAFDGLGSSDPDGSLTAFAWTFGDGATGATAQTSHVYAAPGTYPVTLMVTDNEGATASTTMDVAVTLKPNQAPTATVSGPTDAVAGATTDWDGSQSVDPDGSITATTWDFGDGSTANGVQVQHVYAAAGSYRVVLTVTDDQGATGSASQVVSIAAANAAPTASFTAPHNLKAGKATLFDGRASSDSDGSITAWGWDFGDGTTGTGATAQHTYTQPGAYTVTLTVTDDRGATGSLGRAVQVDGKCKGPKGGC